MVEAVGLAVDRIPTTKKAEAFWSQYLKTCLAGLDVVPAATVTMHHLSRLSVLHLRNQFANTHKPSAKKDTIIPLFIIHKQI